MSKELTPKQRKFAELYVNEYQQGKGTLADIYYKAGYTRNASTETARRDAITFSTNENVAAYIKELQQQYNKQNPITKAELVGYLVELIEDCRRDKFTIDREGNKKIDPQIGNTMIKAAQQISAMCGLDAPEKVETKLKIDFGKDVDEWMK